MNTQKNGRGILCITLLALTFFSGCPGPQDSSPPPVYTVSVAEGITNGAITVNPTSAKEGMGITVTVTPDSGWQLQAGSLKYNDGTDHAITGNTFTMPAANVTVAAVFEPAGGPQYTITIQQATGGSISASVATAAAGQTITVTVTPETGKKLADSGLKYNGTVIPVSGNRGTFTMPAGDVTITAEFVGLASNEHYISVPVTAGGSISVPATGIEGASITVTVSPSVGYQLQTGSLKYNNTVISGPSYTFTMPAANVTVTAVFEKIPYTVTAGTFANGTISIGGGATHYVGDMVTLTVTPAGGYQLQAGSLKYNNIAISGPPYTFTMPAANVTVTGVFEPAGSSQYNITIQQVTGGSISASGATAAADQTVTVTVTPNTGWRLQAGSLKYNGTVISGPPPYTFTMPAANVTVTAAFEKLPIPVSGVSVTPSTAELVAGASLSLTANITPSDAANKGVTWTSSNAGVATVSGSGLTATVNAVGTGSATITAATADGGFTDTCVVTVKIGAGFVVNFNGFGDEAIDLTLSTVNDLSKRNYDGLTVTYTGSGSVTWYIDSQSYGGGTGISVYAGWSDISLGVHYLTAVIEDGTAYASKEITFRVVE
jgi:hypothetical protein